MQVMDLSKRYWGYDMSRLEKYSSYKDSGVEWLGEIPEGWDLVRLGSKFIERREKVSDKDFEPLSVTKNGVVPQLDNAAKTNDGDNRKLVKKGDFVINSRSDRKGSSGVSYLDGSVSLINIVINPININTSFCNYLLKSNGFIEEFYRNGHGIVADLWTTRYWDMKSIMLGIPPLHEQTLIASFLDNKTAQIDKAISQKQKLIEFLKERRQIVINDAVTKGLEKDVEFLDSGVEWIGEIPKHWEISKLGTSLKPISIKNRADLALLSVTREQGVILRDVEDKESNHNFIPDDLSGYKMVEKGQFAMNKMKAWQGSYGISDYTGIVSPAYFIFELNGIEPTFFHKAIRSSVYVPFFIKASDGVRIGQWDLSKSRMKEIPFYIPPKNEQLQIVEYIENQTTKIDIAIELQQNYISKLKEYKATLIDSVVTGKVRVV